MINLLSKETIDKIAAGEVVERPESVVKELLDNAVDSGATAISIEIRGGGLELIRVTDNGSGIAREDIPRAFLRHATSKLATADDLEHIATMGFRGEALASICGVSEVELITKQSGDLMGYRYRIEGGAERDLSEIGAPDGTSVLVRNLFYNVPVRKRFLKSKVTEASYIADVAEKAALAHPEIAVSLLSDGKALLHTSGNGSLKDVIYTVYGREMTQNLIAVDYEAASGLRVSGFIGKPVIARAKRDYEVYFVNGRHVHSATVDRAVEEAYQPFMMQHRFPFVMLSLSILPECVDVNVHPKKMEVRFSDGQLVYDAVFAAIKDRLLDEELIIDALADKKPQKAPKLTYGADNAVMPKQFRAEPFELRKEAMHGAANERPNGEFYGNCADGLKASKTNELKTGETETAAGNASGILAEASAPYGAQFGSEQKAKGSAEIPAQSASRGNSDIFASASAVSKAQPEAAAPSEPQQTQANPSISEPQQTQTHSAAEDAPQQQTLPIDRFLSEAGAQRFRMIGQIFDTYWIIEYEDSMYLIDQHAAHEKVNYERLMKRLSARAIESQQIFPPVLLNLSPKEAALLSGRIGIFSELGFEIEPAGDRDFVVRAVPAGLPRLSDRALLTELIDSLSEERSDLAPEVLRDKVASMSCKAAVKGNRVLTKEEMEALVAELLKLENPYACPHGRPTIAKWTKYELDKIFKRVVS